MEIRGGWKNAFEQKNKVGMKNPARLNPNKGGLENRARLNQNKGGWKNAFEQKIRGGLEISPSNTLRTEISPSNRNKEGDGKYGVGTGLGRMALVLGSGPGRAPSASTACVVAGAWRLLSQNKGRMELTLRTQK